MGLYHVDKDDKIAINLSGKTAPLYNVGIRGDHSCAVNALMTAVVYYWLNGQYNPPVADMAFVLKNAFKLNQDSNYNRILKANSDLSNPNNSLNKIQCLTDFNDWLTSSTALGDQALVDAFKNFLSQHVKQKDGLASIVEYLAPAFRYMALDNIKCEIQAKPFEYNSQYNELLCDGYISYDESSRIYSLEPKFDSLYSDGENLHGDVLCVLGKILKVNLNIYKKINKNDPALTLVRNQEQKNETTTLSFYFHGEGDTAHYDLLVDSNEHDNFGYQLKSYPDKVIPQKKKKNGFGVESSSSNKDKSKTKLSPDASKKSSPLAESLTSAISKKTKPDKKTLSTEKDDTHQTTFEEVKERLQHEDSDLVLKQIKHKDKITISCSSAKDKDTSEIEVEGAKLTTTHSNNNTRRAMRTFYELSFKKNGQPPIVKFSTDDESEAKAFALELLDHGIVPVWKEHAQNDLLTLLDKTQQQTYYNVKNDILFKYRGDNSCGEPIVPEDTSYHSSTPVM